MTKKMIVYLKNFSQKSPIKILELIFLSYLFWARKLLWYLHQLDHVREIQNIIKIICWNETSMHTYIRN